MYITSLTIHFLVVHVLPVVVVVLYAKFKRKVLVTKTPWLSFHSSQGHGSFALRHQSKISRIQEHISSTLTDSTLCCCTMSYRFSST